MHPELSKKLTHEQLEEALMTEGLFSENVVLEEVNYPLVYIRFTSVNGEVRLLRFDATNYDTLPVQVEPVDPITRQPLSPERWMRRGGGVFPGHTMRSEQPFLCLQGTREYYTHEGHRPAVTGDRWESRRNEFKLRHLIAAISERFQRGEWT